MINYVPALEEFRTVRLWMEDGQDLRAVLLAEETAAAAYMQLARQSPGRQAAVLQQLARDAQAHVACLEGICVLVTGEVPEIRIPTPEPGQAVTVLRKCYGKAMRTLVTYEARSHDREYGPVFARLAAQQQEQCRRILELLGSLAP